MRRLTWFLPALLCCGAAFAQNSGIDRSFGDNGIASISDPQQPTSELQGFVSCAMPGGKLRMVARLNPTQIGSQLVDANGQTSGSLARISVHTESWEGGGFQAIGACMGDGRIVIAREVVGTFRSAHPDGNLFDSNLHVVRLRSDGSLDPEFGFGGEVLLDMDGYTTGLDVRETPLGINLEPDGGVLVSMALEVTGGGSNAGLVRLAADGSVRFARRYAIFPTLPSGDSTLYASAAGVAANGQIWMAGTAALTSGTAAFRVRLDGDGILVNAPVFSGGADSVYTGGGRVLADGDTMVLAARSTADGQRYLPRLIVFRDSEVSQLALPEPFAIAGASASLPAFESWVSSAGTVIPTGEGRFLLVDGLARMPSLSAPVATYLSLIQLGATAAGDQVDTRFGIAGRTQFAWRGMQICTAAAPPPQRPMHATNWRGRPLLTGWHSRTCDLNNKRALLARVLYAGDVFSNGFE